MSYAIRALLIYALNRVCFSVLKYRGAGLWAWDRPCYGTIFCWSFCDVKSVVQNR